MTLARRAVGLFVAIVATGLIGMLVLTQLVPRTGRSVLVIHGSSMAPANPLGAVVVTEPVDPAAVRAGDVVTIRTDSGLIYTHRAIPT